MSKSGGVLIVGAGWIGRQVGLRMALCGIEVHLVDRAPAVCQAAEAWMQSVAESYQSAIAADLANARTGNPTGAPATLPDASGQANGASRWPDITHASMSTWRSRMQFHQGLESVPEELTVVLECVPEQITLKRRVLREISQRFPPPVIMASNSSYFTPTTLAQFVRAPERFAHWHFHVPLHHASIVDIVGTPQTEAWVLDTLEQLTLDMVQSPLRLRREHPGYVFNWLLQSLLRSALELAAHDVADIQDIDRAWRTVTGMPLGPFAMMDNIGLDVIEQVLANARWHDAPPVPIEQLLAILREPIEQGRLGVKSGQGFYDHRQQ